MKTMRVQACIAVATVFLALPTARAALLPNLDVRAGLEIRYDDNVFQYSDENLKAFDNGLAKYNSLVSTSDVVWVPSVGAAYRIPNPLSTRLAFEWEPKFYQRNTIKNYQVFTTRLSQELPNRFGLDLRYLFVPRFFLRPLADPPNQTGTYTDADFTLNSLRLSLDRDFSPQFSGGLSGRYERKDYNLSFDERDTTVTGGDVEGRFRPHRAVRIAAGIGYERGKARGENDPTVNSDVSYHQWSVRLGPVLEWDKRWRLRLSYTYESKQFTTDLSADTTHFDRNDIASIEEIELKARLTKQLDAYIGYERTDKTSNNRAQDLEFASFDENRLSLGIVYDF